MEGRNNSRPRSVRRTADLQTQICLAQNPFILISQQQAQQQILQSNSLDDRLGGNHRVVQTNSDNFTRKTKPKQNRTKRKSNDAGTGAKLSTQSKAYRGFKFSPSQRGKLEAAFALKRYPSPNDVQFLADEIHARTDQVRNWFHDQRRRQKSLDICEANQIGVGYHLNLETQKFVDRYTNSKVRPGVNHMQPKFKDSSGKLSRAFKFDEEQRLKLRSFFNRKRYPNSNEMSQLALELGVMREQVRNWFHDQRRKLKQETLGL